MSSNQADIKFTTQFEKKENNTKIIEDN